MTTNSRTTPLSDGVASAYRGAQARADSAVRALGDTSGAPPWLDGERLVDYRRRLLEPLKPHSPTWRNVDVPRAEDVLRVAENQIYADASYAAEHPIVPPGQMIERTTTDRTGRRITRFHGDPAAWLNDFKLPTQYVTGIGPPR
jgi:hypothetical protein